LFHHGADKLHRHPAAQNKIRGDKMVTTAPVMQGIFRQHFNLSSAAKLL